MYIYIYPLELEAIFLRYKAEASMYGDAPERTIHFEEFLTVPVGGKVVSEGWIPSLQPLSGSRVRLYASWQFWDLLMVCILVLVRTVLSQLGASSAAVVEMEFPHSGFAGDCQNNEEKVLTMGDPNWEFTAIHNKNRHHNFKGSLDEGLLADLACTASCFSRGPDLGLTSTV